MALLISNEVLELFVASGTYDALPAAIERRFGGIVDTVTIDIAPGSDRKTALKLVDAIHRIPSRFERFETQASERRCELDAARHHGFFSRDGAT